MFPNNLQDTKSVFPNLIQVGLLPLVFLPIASLPHHCPSYHSLQQFHHPALFQIFYFPATSPHQVPALPR